ncbi:predicted protein [Naegleria gruberi]|uniref:Predicted protein n=1 Tax=Naegleria gruberi TaxID=5762 RepID=D2VYS2_NAEGR|nr:uncharacterized protein NAEGRDRAFT_74221 [Naegleria gruberi]EFC38005.1 predicted protein [Naegleria gruberi]|eukprot:XP_002670749.1 predicted protein [Naegleria gruberi strain NEG-M]
MQRPVIVFEMGSLNTRVGMAGDETPEHIFQTLVGRLNNGKEIVGEKVDELYGKEEMELTKPVKEGMIDNWQDAELIFHHGMSKQLGEKSDWSDYSILLFDHPFTEHSDRMKSSEIILESLGLSGLNFIQNCVASSFAHGETKATVLTSGDELTYVLSIHEGRLIPHTTEKYSKAGRDLTQVMLEGMEFSDSSNYDEYTRMKFARMAKETLAHLARSGKSVSTTRFQLPELTNFELPDGNTVRVFASTRLACTESLFQDEEFSSFVYYRIPLSDGSKDERSGTLILNGGNTLLEGFDKRLDAEVTRAFHRIGNVSVLPSIENSAWVGGSILASFTQFSLISKREYEEMGKQVLEKKIF